MILAVEAASNDVSLAVLDAGGSLMAQDAWATSHRQSAELLPRLLALIEGAGGTLRDTTAVAVGLGPGSFTGLRVALALAKGIAVSLHAPIVGVPSLLAWLEAHPDSALAIARAGAREAYVLRRGETEPRIVDQAELMGLVVDARIVVPADLAEAFGLAGAEAPRAAGALGRMAAERLHAGFGDDVRTLEPIYLRAPRGVAAAPEGEVRWL